MNKLGTKLGAIAMSAVMALTFAPSAAITSLAAGGDDLTDATQLSVPVYRLYNPNSGEHLFTTSENECDSLDKNGWDFETIAWYAPTVGDQVYRLYNPNHPLGDHHYTASEEERDNLIKQGWRLDATAFNTVAEGDVPLGAPIYSLYNPNAYDLGMATHHLTLSKEEADGLALLGWTNEGAKFYEYAEDLDPVVEELTVSINNTTPKVGDTLNAITVGGEGEYSYQWYAGDEAIPGADDDELLVTGDLRDLQISVSVTDAEGNTAKSDPTFPVAKDLSAEVTITDLDGLQDDGTALPTDTLQLSYGAGLGTPENIIWYKDGAAAKINTARGGFAGAFQTVPRNVAGNATLAKGEWYVIVQNTEGDNFVSNSIIVTVDDQAVMTDVTITEDYDTPNIEYTKTTSTAVITVTLNKDYAGTFYLAPDARTTFYNSVDLVNEITTAETVNTALKNMTDKNAIAELTDGDAIYGLKYLDEETGEVTYKFAVKMDNANGQAVKRGSDYNLIFDQDDYDDDNLETTSGKGSLDDLDLNMTDALTIPYVETPDSAAVTLYAATNGAAATIKVGLYDEDGEVLSWYKDATAEAGVGVLPGFSSLKVYNVTENKAADTDDPCPGPSNAVADKGVATLTYTGNASQFAYVKLETTAGVFAADSVTLQTEVVETIGPALDSLKVKQSSSEPKDAVIELKNLTKRGSGTVYLFQSGKQAGATVNDDGTENTAAVITAQNKDGAWMLGSATVEGGSSSVTIPNVFDKSVIGATAAAGAEKYNDYYAALFVPDDTEYYAELASAPFLLKHELKSYKLDGTFAKQTQAVLTAGLAKAIKGVDQFGDAFELDATTGATLANVTAADKKLSDTLTAEAGPGTFDVSITAVGTLTVNDFKGSGTASAEADGDWVSGTSLSLDLPGGQKLVIACDTTSDVTNGTNATFKVTIS